MGCIGVMHIVDSRQIARIVFFKLQGNEFSDLNLEVDFFFLNQECLRKKNSQDSMPNSGFEILHVEMFL